VSDDKHVKDGAVDTMDVQSSNDDTTSKAARRIQKLGPSLIHYLFSASKTVQVHDLNNDAVQRVLSELKDCLHELIYIDGQLSIRVSAELLTINDTRVSIDPQLYGSFLYLVEEMKKRKVEGFDFSVDIDEAEVGRFLKFFFVDAPWDCDFDELVDKLSAAGVENIQLVEWQERERRLDGKVEVCEGLKAESNRVFFRMVNLTGEILKGIEARRAIRVRKAERLTQQMVDIIEADESILVGLASIKSFDEYTFAHSVNVCILSMLMGDRLQLYKEDIARLGVAALLHDIGKTYIPRHVLNTPEKLDENDWELMKYHTFFGVKELSRINALREIADALFVALQHHVHVNMNGYPQKPSGWDLRFFSRIVTIADYYDAMTSPRVYKETPLTPDKALAFILQKSGEVFDPFIAKVFIKAMGAFPTGSVVELDTGATGVVIRQNPAGRYIHRPIVAIFDPAADGAGAETVDLTDKSKDGRYLRSIVQTTYKEDTERLKNQHFLTD
jgi:HD-GYP domain-containing protein (c-di-GMP phosphodiesterase class II)